MRITRVLVKGLFGMFDHDIQLNQDSRITIIHGPNGVGKTVLMRLVHGLFNYDYAYIGSVPFEMLWIDYEDGTIVKVKGIARKDDRRKVTSLHITCIGESRETDTAFTPLIADDAWLDKQIEALRPDLTSVKVPWARPSWYWVALGGLEAQDSQVRTRAAVLREIPDLHERTYGEIPAWFVKIQRQTSSRLLLADRLVCEEMDDEMWWAVYFSSSNNDPNRQFYPSPRDSVSDIRYDFSMRIRSAFGKSKEFEKLRPNGFQELEYEARELTSTLEALDKVICEMNRTLEEVSIKASLQVSSALAADHEGYKREREYLFERLQLTSKKLELASAADLFIDIINERFLFKSMEFFAVPSEDHSDDKHLVCFRFVVDSALKDDKRETIPDSQLSSGEQHLLTLYYRLLFEVEPNSLVMIDEPELSINVVWQRNFLKDLQRIIELRKFDVVIATHSLEIINDKWDWIVALGE